MDPITHLNPDEIPEGFTSIDPNNPGSTNIMDPQKAKEAQADAKRQAILDQALTVEARERLRRIKLVKPERVEKLEKTIAAMAMQGKLPGRINEGKLIEMLEGMIGKEKQGSVSTGKISIQRKKYAFDSDDSDDDDDDDLM